MTRPPVEVGARTLSAERIVAVAIQLADAHGADMLSIRQLATALGVTPMALYNHIPTKKDLLAASARTILAEAEFSDQGDGWRDRIARVFVTMRELCLRHPATVRLLELSDTAPIELQLPLATTLAALRDVSIKGDDALRCYFTLVGFTLAQSGYQTRRPFPALEGSHRPQGVTGAGAAPWDFDLAFRYGLDLILDGIEASISRSCTATDDTMHNL